MSANGATMETFRESEVLLWVLSMIPLQVFNKKYSLWGCRGNRIIKRSEVSSDDSASVEWIYLPWLEPAVRRAGPRQWWPLQHRSSAQYPTIINNSFNIPPIIHSIINKKFKRKKTKILLSISDEKKYAVAFVTISL